jgi:chemotaxis protein CheD
MPDKPVRLWTVTGSGVVMTIFDRKRRFGGMAHYLLAEDESSPNSSPIYAKGAVFGLLKFFRENGSSFGDLVASIYGAACNPKAPGYVENLHKCNVQACSKILSRFKIDMAGCDVGGHWGRKIAFESHTGECVVVKTEKIRSEDWYPVTR